MAPDKWHGRDDESMPGALSIHVDVAEATVNFKATGDAFRHLGNWIAAFVESGDCHCSMGPFEAGSARFHSSEPSDAGLYLHLQPCPTQVKSFPEAHGIGWFCFAGSFDGAPSEERGYDPTYVVIESGEDGFRWLAERVLAFASGSKAADLNPSESGLFGPSPFRIRLSMRDSAE
ncbi:MAG: hypothetical protein U0Q16_38945 [Bryobacteraceae bacterium]